MGRGDEKRGREGQDESVRQRDEAKGRGERRMI